MTTGLRWAAEILWWEVPVFQGLPTRVRVIASDGLCGVPSNDGRTQSEFRV